jgi:multiple sugar transport system permease protein
VTATLAGTGRVAPSRAPGRRPGRRPRPAVAPTVLLLLGALYCLAPVLWVLVAATKNNNQLFSTFTFAPDGSLWSNIRSLSDYQGGVFWEWMLNSALYAGGGALVSAALSGLTGRCWSTCCWPGCSCPAWCSPSRSTCCWPRSA